VYKYIVEQNREGLRELSRRLMRLHRLLLDRERETYEERHGPIPPGQVLHLVLNDEHFAWLRTLSALMAQIDEVVDAGEPLVKDDAETAFREAYRLLKSGDGGTFQRRYYGVLQDSPDVVMAHAAVSEVLRAAGAAGKPGGPERDRAT
jgi:hypothetical protein